MTQESRPGRKMKPIADDVGPHRRELAVALRDLVHASLPAGAAAGALAPLMKETARSTLFHILAGKRVPSWSTMEDLLDTCATVRRAPALLHSLRLPGSAARFTKVPASSEEYERFELLWKNAHSEASAARFAADHAAALQLAVSAVGGPQKSIPPGHQFTRAHAEMSETVSVAEAMEAVRLAQLRVKEATTELSRAQDRLDRALARQELDAKMDEFLTLREAAEVRQRITRLLVQLQSRLHDSAHPLPAKDHQTGLRIEEELREWLVRLAMADDDQDPEARRATHEDVRQKLERVRSRFGRIGISA